MDQTQDRWIDIAIRVAAVVVVGLVVYITWTYVQHIQSETVSSPAARAITNLQRGVTQQPQNPALRVRLAEALAAAGRTDEAIGQFQAALTIDKEFVPALLGLGKVSMQREEWKTAEAYWRKVIDMLEGKQTAGPQLDQAYYGLGVTYLSTKRYEDAAGALKQALAIRKDASDSHYMLSVAYRELGYFDKQKQELDIALLFDPNYAQANYDRGLVALKDGDTATAAELFRAAADNIESVDLPQQELDKLAAEASADQRIARAKVAGAGKAKEALTDARIAAALEPDNIEAVRLVARLSETEKDTQRALNAWQRVLELVPQDAVAIAAVKRLETDGGK